MPRIYLSPSTQELNTYITGGSEEYYMNLVANAMVPYLTASGIQYIRNYPYMTEQQSIDQANAGNYDLYLALHSNTAPANKEGTLQGSTVYYYPQSTDGRKAADIFAKNLKKIYPDPSLVKSAPNTTLRELTQTNAPSVYVELGYHDNLKDTQWIISNINEIGKNLAYSVAEFLNVPFKEPFAPKFGIVNINSGNLNIRSSPNTNAAVVGRVGKGARVRILQRLRDWYLIEHNNMTGYVSSSYIKPQQ